MRAKLIAIILVLAGCNERIQFTPQPIEIYKNGTEGITFVEFPKHTSELPESELAFKNGLAYEVAQSTPFTGIVRVEKNNFLSNLQGNRALAIYEEGLLKNVTVFEEKGESNDYSVNTQLNVLARKLDEQSDTSTFIGRYQLLGNTEDSSDLIGVEFSLDSVQKNSEGDVLVTGISQIELSLYSLLADEAHLNSNISEQRRRIENFSLSDLELPLAAPHQILEFSLFFIAFIMSHEEPLDYQVKALDDSGELIAEIRYDKVSTEMLLNSWALIPDKKLIITYDCSMPSVFSEMYPGLGANYKTKAEIGLREWNLNPTRTISNILDNMMNVEFEWPWPAYCSLTDHEPRDSWGDMSYDRPSNEDIDEMNLREIFANLELAATSRKTAIQLAILTGRTDSMDELDGGKHGIPENEFVNETQFGLVVDDGVIEATWKLDGSILSGKTYTWRPTSMNSPLPGVVGGSCRTGAIELCGIQ